MPRENVRFGRVTSSLAAQRLRTALARVGGPAASAALAAAMAASVTTGAPAVNRRRSSPATSRAGNGSAAAARDSAASGSGWSLAKITRLPRRRPRSTLGSATMHVCEYTERMVATADRAAPSPSCGPRGGVPGRRRSRGDVHRVDAARAQRAGGRGGELRRRQVPRRHRPGEHVGDHQVIAGCPDRLGHVTRVGGAHPDAVPRGQRQPLADHAGQRVVEFGDQLPRPRPGMREIAGQGQRTAAQVQRAERLAGREGQVGDVPDPADVLELEVTGVGEVDTALRDPVDEQ